MKLRNKRTGEIVDNAYLFYGNGMRVHSLAEINKEWEDYEKPKGYWYIDYDGRIHKEDYAIEEEYKDMLEIGNYFETKKEAEKAVEKLKAFKRLKDKGFRFTEWYPVDEGLPNLKIDANINIPNKNIDNGDIDLNLLFGGEE